MYCCNKLKVTFLFAYRECLLLYNVKVTEGTVCVDKNNQYKTAKEKEENCNYQETW